LKPVTEFANSITVSYFDMNTQQDLNTQYIPANIQGVLSTKELKGTSTSIYPNPVKDKLFVENTHEEEIQIFDVQGKLVLKADDARIIDVSGLQEGVYFLKAEHKTSKFIKQ